MREPKKVRTRPELEKSCRMLREHNEKLKATIKRVNKLQDFPLDALLNDMSDNGKPMTYVCKDSLDAALEQTNEQ